MQKEHLHRRRLQLLQYYQMIDFFSEDHEIVTLQHHLRVRFETFDAPWLQSQPKNHETLLNRRNWIRNTSDTCKCKIIQKTTYDNLNQN